VLGQHVTVRLHQNVDISDEPRYFYGIVEQVSWSARAAAFSST